MKTSFWILFSLFFIIYSSKPTLSIKPFAISFESPYTPFGIIFLILSLSCFQLQTRKDTKKELIKTYYVEGINDGFDKAVESINLELKKQGKESKIIIESNN